MKRFALIYLLALGIFGGVQQSPQPAPSPAPYREPDHKAGPGHFKRPDDAMCAPIGDHPCACALVCEKGADGEAVVPHMGDQCQWFCTEDKCSCHPCEDCEEVAGHAQP